MEQAALTEETSLVPSPADGSTLGVAALPTARPDAEMAVYRIPYLNPGEDRRPTLSFPLEPAIDWKSTHMARINQDNADGKATSDIPKLFTIGDPGAILVSGMREFCSTRQNQMAVIVRGRHFLQEDSPNEIGRAIAHRLGKFPSGATVQTIGEKHANSH
jgi:hypothetical protein